MKYADIVINSDDEVYIDGKYKEKPKPKSFRNYMTDSQKQFIIDNFTNTSDLKLTTNTET